MKEFIVYSEFEKANVYGPALRNEFVDEINFRVRKGKLDFEFLLKLVGLSHEKLTLKLEVFDDAFLAFKHCREVFELLGAYSESYATGAPEDILEYVADSIEKAGWKRKHPSRKEIVRQKPLCPTCGQGKKS